MECNQMYDYFNVSPTYELEFYVQKVEFHQTISVFDRAITKLNILNLGLIPVFNWTETICNTDR